MSKRGIVDGGEEDGQWLDSDQDQTRDERLLHQQSDMTADQSGIRLTNSNYEENKVRKNYSHLFNNIVFGSHLLFVFNHLLDF